MFGVILALYLNNYYERKSLSDDKEIALSQVLVELSENRSSLKDYYSIINEKYIELNYLFSKLNDESEIVLHKDSIEVFKEKSKLIFEFDEFENLDSEFVNMKGDLNLYIESPLMASSLSNITWESYKKTDYLTITDFKCLTEIEGLYELQNEVNELNKRWRDTFLQGRFLQNSLSREEFLSEWKSLLTKQELLLEVYSFKDGILKNCG